MNTLPLSGSSLTYSDGRPGHTSQATVLHVTPLFMVVQFTDRADTTTIRFSDSAWMKYITFNQ